MGQQDVLLNFSPRNMQDGDYSRPITAYVKQARDRQGGGGHVHQLVEPSRSSRSGYDRDRNSSRHEERRSSSSRHGAGSWLGAFRTCYPMDDRAFDFLEQSAVEVQEAILTEFKPRRPGEDDYSGAVTSFIRKVRSRYEAGGGARSEKRWRSDDTPVVLLEAFKSRYPMDDRAWDFLSTSPASLQRTVLERFQPKREGEGDYSRLITSFIRSNR